MLRSRPRLARILRRAAAVLLLLVIAYFVNEWWHRRAPQPETEIYPGVTYACVRLPDNDEGGGLMHYTRVDLSTPGLDLYTTPTAPKALDAGWQYPLRYVEDAVNDAHLAVAVNGVYFQRSTFLPFPGTFARGVETVVAAHQVSHDDPGSFLLWFEDDLTPHFEATRPPPPEALRRARWAIGGNLIYLHDGKIGGSVGLRVERRTLVGVDPNRRLLWLAVIDRASERRAAQELLNLGATDAIALDGGSSTEMALGPAARGARPGSVVRTWVPTATVFGVQGGKE